MRAPVRLPPARSVAAVLAVLAGVASPLLIGACTGSGSTTGSSVSGPPGTDPVSPDTTMFTEPSTTHPTTTSSTSTSSTSTSTTSSTTSTTSTTSTLPGRGLVPFLADGSAVPPLPLSTAQAIYEAIGRGDDESLRALIIRGRLRANVVSPGNDDLVTRMRAEAADGTGTPLADIRRILETPAAVTADGAVVWPGVAVKEPATWDAADEEVLRALGFGPDAIAATRAKGKYVDERIVISAEGTWTGFLVGN